ncbi:6d625c46-ec08-48f9-b525-4489e59508ff [Sclerotinia trifoliorum]|uniref:6d625c46-ec08-48f9-b525-4489e59508ff n=1 Tax=Sclerotinia trifoliorum TaxID=28548 RepID=A0A8H2ZQM9_9HELO|nr:6d625c46-ec08-48f9-b525-4489e59508ff [Sclerotinia trifoliorum]
MSPTDENAAAVKRKQYGQKFPHNPKVSRSVEKRNKPFEVHVKKDGQVEIFLHERFAANCELFKNILGLGGATQCFCDGCLIGDLELRTRWIQAWASQLERKLQRANIVHSATARLEDLISKENPSQKLKCRFCEDSSTCPLQSHNITSEQAPPKMESTENSEEKRFEDASRDQFNADKLFEVGWRNPQTPT